MAGVEGFDRSSLTDKVYSLLKDRILSQALQPGQKVDIDSLAAELGISRTPAKDALSRLASDSLVMVFPRRGTFVARFDLNDLAELLDVRLALEMHAARVGTSQASPEHVREMRAVLRRLELDFPGDQQVQRNYDGFLAPDRRFHTLVVATAANRKLLELYEKLHVEFQVARFYYGRGNLEIDKVHAEHGAILAAFERRDADAAVRAVQRHLERVRRSLCLGEASLEGIVREAALARMP